MRKLPSGHDQGTTGYECDEYDGCDDREDDYREAGGGCARHYAVGGGWRWGLHRDGGGRLRRRWRRAGDLHGSGKNRWADIRGRGWVLVLLGRRHGPATGGQCG
ncbi:MAG: hypothetical protein FWF21_11810, partial [Micrococcales bacterium]|nr:hypothetical protein [Micrococcales bacterium]